MRLIRGAPGTGKTALVFREFKQALGTGRRDIRIVVPTATLVRHFQHELARDGAVFPPSAVVSLSRFALECAPNSKLIPDGLLRAIVRDVLRRIAPAEFADVANTEGMASTILETVALFENAAWTPDKLAATRKLTNYAKTFQKLWTAIDAAVTATGHLTRAGIFRAATKQTQPLIQQGRIWMDGFLNLSPIESQFVATLAKTSDLTITLTDSRTTDDIRLFAMQHGAQDRLLTGPPRRAQIKATAASTMERETDEIARRVLQLHDNGTPFREIGVALRETSIYHPLLQGTFERFGIPARFYFSMPLRKHPTETFLSGLIGCVLNGWEFGSVLETIQSHPAWGHSSAFDRFDFKVREAMPGAGVGELLKLAEEDFAKRIHRCFELDAWHDYKTNPLDWARRLEEMARSLYRPGLLDPASDSVETARSQTAALAAWIDAVASAASFWPEPQQPLSLQEFWDITREVVEGASVHVPDDRRDVVHVMSAFEARQWDVSALIVCGMTDRDYPRRNPQNLLFPDADIEALRLPIRKSSDRDNEEKALWEALKTRARDSLFLTWPEHDAGGNSVQFSRHLTDLDIEFEKSQHCRATPPVEIESTGLTGRIHAPELLTALTAQHRKISLSSLEDLVQCRFKFFAGRTLGLKPRPERPQERLDRRVGGLILHMALEAWLDDNRQGDFVARYETAFDEMVREKHLTQGFRLEMERILLREVARKVSAAEQWTPVSSEAEVELALDFQSGVTVTCRVDRIDRMNETDCVIVDYKSGRTANVEKLVGSKTKLQGPLYALAAKEQLNLNTVAMMYVAVREDLRFGWGAVPGVDLGLLEIPPNWMEDARERSTERLVDFLGGAVQAEPAEPDNCRWCDYKEACRVEQRQALVMIEGGSHA